MKHYQKNARILNMHFVFMFDHIKMGEQWQFIWTLFEFKFGVEFANSLQCTSIKWNWQDINTMYIILYNMIMCLYIVYSYWLLCLLCLLSNRSGAGTRDHPGSWRLPIWPSSARQANPIDHVDKNPLLSHSRLSIVRIISWHVSIV